MRSNTRDASTGVSISISRARFMAADDTKMMQEAQVQVFHDEVHDGVEHWQPYGRRIVPLPPDQNSPKAAEALVAYLGGSRSHPVVVAVADRRGAPMGGKPGDVVDWHYKGNTEGWTDAGKAYSGGVNKMSASWTVGNLKVTWTDGKACVQVGGSNGPALVVKTDAVYAGGDPDQGGTFMPVQTTGGPSSKFRALVG